MIVPPGMTTTTTTTTDMDMGMDMVRLRTHMAAASGGCWRRWC
jgi:hypothetical protein